MLAPRSRGVKDGLVALLLIQVAIPPPVGFVNDFAGVLDPASSSRIEAVVAQVREKSRGEIAVVTLPDIGDRAASAVALQIGRQWGVGAKGAAGDPAKNLGVVVLLVPLKNHRPGTGQVFIATGRGAEGFLPDAQVGRIRDAMIPYLAREDYAGGLEVGVRLIAQAFAAEFGFTLTGQPPPPVDQSDRLPIPPGVLIAIVLLLIVLSRGRILFLPLWFGGFGGGWGGGRGGGGGGGGGRRGGFGGGFGGFGGGGGFSGGGAGGRF